MLLLLDLLPLMYFLELADFMFFVNSYKYQSNRFNILNFVSISNINTRSSDKIILSAMCGPLLANPGIFTSIDYPDYGIDYLQLTSLCPVNAKLREFLWNHFRNNFESDNPCTYHFLCPCHKCSAIPVSIS